jgi:hypothetical protein
MFIKIKTILNVSIKLASYKIECIVLILWLCSSGSMYVCTVVLLVWLPDWDCLSLSDSHTNNTTVQIYILPREQSQSINTIHSIL